VSIFSAGVDFGALNGAKIPRINMTAKYLKYKGYLLKELPRDPATLRPTYLDLVISEIR
jgi:uncharacterized protein YnzC (UPF0291/DUF896 family)